MGCGSSSWAKKGRPNIAVDRSTRTRDVYRGGMGEGGGKVTNAREEKGGKMVRGGASPWLWESFALADAAPEQT